MTPADRAILISIQRNGRVTNALLSVLILLVLGSLVFGQNSATWAAARADRAAFPPGDWGFIFYVSLDHLPADQQADAGRVTAFTVSSFSKSVVLEHHLPVQINQSLYRIDLRGLQWNWKDWWKVLERYPYFPPQHYPNYSAHAKKQGYQCPPPLVVRADWLVVELTDAVESDAGYRMLYGGDKIPATRDDFLKFWGVVTKSNDPLLLAHVENQSGVSLLHIRRIENRPAGNRGYAWGTEDNQRLNFSAKTDPLENLMSDRKHDAEEWIVGFPKISIGQGAGGMAQAYLLSNGEGKRQEVAPVNIVKDATRYRGYDEIRNHGSCIQCHVEGIRPLTRNDLRHVIAAGVDLYADRKSQEAIERTYLAELRLKIEAARNQEDYAAFTAMAAGWGPEANAKQFKALVDAYDQPLDLNAAAREVHLKPEEFKLALAYASNNGVKLGARLAGLAHGQIVPRDFWETQYKKPYEAAEVWRRVKR